MIFLVWKLQVLLPLHSLAATFFLKNPTLFSKKLPFYPNVVFICLPLFQRRRLASSSQATYRLPPCKHESSLISLLLLSPKKSYDFSGAPRSSQGHIPFGRSFNFQGALEELFLFNPFTSSELDRGLYSVFSEKIFSSKYKNRRKA